MSTYETVGKFLVITPAFSAADGLFAFTTLAQQQDGSVASFKARHDEASRRELEAALAPLQLSWLKLEHANRVARIPEELQDPESLKAQAQSIFADAVIIARPGYTAAFTTADCLPIIIASQGQQLIAGIHAGWRGIASGVISNCCAEFIHASGGLPPDTQVWIGPSIAAKDYEIDADTRRLLLKNPLLNTGQLSPARPGHYFADLRAMACTQLEAAGIKPEWISVQPVSTYAESRFHSARRDGDKSGRMATVIGILA